MKLSPSDLRLYAVTDRRALPVGVTLAQAVEAALDGGVTCLQLREKEASAGEILALARTLLPLCRARRVPLLINDRVDIALVAGADGVHLGQEDLPLPRPGPCWVPTASWGPPPTPWPRPSGPRRRGRTTWGWGPCSPPAPRRTPSPPRRTP